MKSRTLPYYEFKKGIFEIDEFDCASIFVIVGEKRALVLDTGTGIGDLRWVIENRITDKPYDVVITHNHGDHIGGAGFFDSVWVHEKDFDWSDTETGMSLEFRKKYASIIANREGKNYNYELERDIVEWTKEPQKKIMKDGQVFDLGGRTVTIFHCPGHTAGECVAIDDVSKTLFVGDACNQNLLIGKGIGHNTAEAASVAKNALLRIYNMKDKYEDVYNSHHDFRGFGAPLNKDVLPDVITCLNLLQNGNATIAIVPDTLFPENGDKIVAKYGKVQISYIGGRIDKME